jgi:hypothetical protein
MTLGFIGLSISATAGHAQETGTTVTLTVSPSYVNFAGFGGGFGAAVARLSVSRGFTSLTGGELSVFALAPLGGATSIPGCVPEVPCRTTTTPSLLSGFLTSAFLDAGDTGLRLTLGVGGVTASGGEGFPHRSSGAAVVGLDWLPNTTNRFAPTIAVRLVQLASPIAGARQLLLPGVGLRF